MIMNNDVFFKCFRHSAWSPSKTDFEKHGDCENDVRRVFMEVSIAEKLAILHMLQFAD